MSTPTTPTPLSAANIGSFAYLTVKDRLPVILTKVIDYLYRERVAIGEKYGEIAREEVKEVIGRLSQLKNEMQTNKPLQLLQPSANNPHDDAECWNERYESYTNIDGVPPKWYTAPWLYVECFMYAKIHEAFYLCDSLKDFDPFMDQKQNSLLESSIGCEALISHTLYICNNISEFSQQQIKEHVINLFEVAVWGNRCDLSISCGAEKNQDNNILHQLDNLRPYLLINHSQKLWQFINSLPEDQRDIVLVLDNAGFELVTDLCLITLLIEAGLANSISIHVKTRPWFVSDTTIHDFNFTLSTFREKGGVFSEISKKWDVFLAGKRWILNECNFWTRHEHYAELINVNKDLYNQLNKASLIIFKGDLNYRKLTGDLDWPTTALFETALQGFNVAPLVALRTVKGGPAVGLEEGQTDDLPNDWNITGNYGMIQLHTGN